MSADVIHFCNHRIDKMLISYVFLTLQFIFKSPISRILGVQVGLGSESEKQRRFKKNVYLPKFSVADPDPGSGAFLSPGSGIRDG
jgi:hypothetical protein